MQPEAQGTASHARYEEYKSATSYEAFRALGGTAADFAHDSAKGFVERKTAAAQS